MTDSYYMDRRSISYPVLHRAVAIPDQLISKFFKLFLCVNGRLVNMEGGIGGYHTNFHGQKSIRIL